MMKYLKSGIGIHALVQFIASFLLILLTTITTHSVVLIIELSLVIVMYLFLMKKFADDIDRQKLFREIKFILLVNLLLLAGGGFVYQFASGTLGDIGQVMIIIGLYFNYGFSTILSLNLPTGIGFVMLGLASPIMLYSGYIMHKGN